MVVTSQCGIKELQTGPLQMRPFPHVEKDNNTTAIALLLHRLTFSAPLATLLKLVVSDFQVEPCWLEALAQAIANSL
jgi:hypothetical protein